MRAIASSTSPAPAAIVSRQVLLGGVVRADGGGDAALRVARAALVHLRLGDEEHGAERAGFERGEEARHAAPDHDRPVAAIRPSGIAHAT